MTRYLRSNPLILLALAFPLAAAPQARQTRALITDKIDETRLHTLAGNRRSEAVERNDRGAVEDSLVLDHMLLQLQRPAEQEKAVQDFIAQLHNSASPNFHHWLTAEQYGRQFGPAQADIDTVTSWLKSQGFTVNHVTPSGMAIDFSGTAGQVRNAFHTAIHRLNVNGADHIANMADPQIPAALAPAVAGVVSLHDFQPHAMSKPHTNFTFTSSGGSTQQAVVPADLAAIYNLNPLFNNGITGAGQTIVVIEDSDLYSAADWTTFQSTFGLTQYGGTLATVHPAPASGVNNCRDPGVPSGGADGEAILDAEWASAAAPGAMIQVAACADTRTTFGGLIALQNLINGNNPPAIVSISYGNCEAENGAASNALFYSTYQQAAAEGVSVFVSSGDEGAASCDAGASAASHGIAVSSFASTPYNVAVGGTDFGDTIAKTNSTYWGSSNSATYGSAISYIPEIPWNDSCAGSLLAGYFGFTAGYGSDGFCSSATAKSDGLQVVAAGSGGPSGCATGAPASLGVVGGTCQGYPKPSWQTGLTGVPADGVRDIPDVSLFAADGVWGHYYVTCWSNRRAGGASCAGAPNTWAGAGGTSFASPIMAGIQALVNQNNGGAQGNPNPVYYKLAANASCNSAEGDPAGSTCVFHNVTTGDIAVNCSGTQNCFDSSSTTTTTTNPTGGRRGGGGTTTTTVVVDGALSTGSGSFAPAYGAGGGWNMATGIGSVNAYNLVMNWKNGM